MAIATNLYAPGIANVISGRVDWERHAILCSLHSNEYEPAPSHAKSRELRGEVASVALKGRKVLPEADGVRLMAAPAIFPLAQERTFRWAVLRRSDTGDLVGWVDLGGDLTAATAVTLEWSAEGIFYIVRV